MERAYNELEYVNKRQPSLNQVNLNRMSKGLSVVDQRVVDMDLTKADQETVLELVSDISFDEITGIITVTKKNGSQIPIKTNLGKIAINASYDPNTEKIIITNSDGTKDYIDLSALITQYEFLNSDTIGFEVQEDGSIKACVLNGSITKEHLQVNYLAEILANLEAVNAAREYAELLVEEAKDMLEKGVTIGPPGIQGPQGERGERGEQGLQGERGEKGERGDSGVTAPINGFFTLSVDKDGNLWAYSSGDGAVPEFEYDSETGNLYIKTAKEEVV